MNRLKAAVADSKLEWNWTPLTIGNERFTMLDLKELLEEHRDAELGVAAEKQIAAMDVKRAEERAENSRKRAFRALKHKRKLEKKLEKLK